jgi:two-component system, sensor histidine kinase and response regulator
MKKILVIDDSAEIREIIEQTLTCEGFRVLGAEDGVSGVELAKHELPDLILCDINMPNLDGFDTLALLRKEALTAAIPFIFLTGAAEKTYFRKGMELGADDFLNKPFNASELMAAVTARLAKHEAVQRRSEQKLDELRGNITLALPHELRTPLNGILGLSTILMEDYKTMQPQEFFETARYIHEAALRLHRLIENFLAYAQIELVSADRAKIALLRAAELIPVGSLISEVAQEKAKIFHREKDLTLQITPADLPISQDHLKKIVEELVDNALKFSDPGTAVNISTATDNGSFRLSITDRGRGMSTEQIAKIGAHMQFERQFYEQQGAGLGLFIAKRLTELYGGQLTIQSSLGQGTIVSFSLPVN